LKASLDKERRFMIRTEQPLSLLHFQIETAGTDSKGITQKEDSQIHNPLDPDVYT
jgi:hypothetical protein